MSESVISDARKQAEDIRNAANSEAAAIKEKAMAETAAELEELRRVKQEVADFKAKLLATYREHLTLIGILEGDSAQPEEKNEETPVVEEPVVESEPVDNAHFDHTVVYDLPDFSSLELDD